MRLLHYVPENAFDSPLSPDKKEISELKNKDEIIKRVISPTDKRYDLDLKSQFCRICFYNGSRQLQKSYNNSARRLQDNIYVTDQIYNFDIYVHVDIDNEDMRLGWICNTLNEILDNKHLTDIGKLRLAFSSPINNTPDGFIGYKMAYITTSLQEMSGKK